MSEPEAKGAEEASSGAARMRDGTEREADGVEEELVAHCEELAAATSHVTVQTSPSAPSARLPLSDVYIALRGEASKSLERHHAALLLQDAVSRQQQQQQQQQQYGEEESTEEEKRAAVLAESPYDLFTVESGGYQPDASRASHAAAAAAAARRAGATRSIDLAEAFRRERALVVLGDPGSGKTTLVKWLAARLAEAFAAGRERVAVPRAQVEPEAKAGGGEVDLGPARVPVLLRVSHYADALRADRALTLEAFLSRLPRGAALASALAGGRLVLLLDGLDEIVARGLRREVVDAVRAFVARHAHDAGRDGGGMPAHGGGNQVVVTSRVVGYHAFPLPVAHVTVEKMSDASVGRFVEQWFCAVDGDTKGRAAAAELLAALRDESRRTGLADMARNPLLLSIVAGLFRSSGGSLPSGRAELYRMAVDELLVSWVNGAGGALSEDDVRRALPPLAYFLHAHYSAGLLPERVLRARLAAAGLGPAKADSLVAQMRARLAVMTERGEGLFGFVHLTFEEFLAGRHLAESGPEAMRAHLELPRWFEPVTLAVGHAAAAWAPERFAALVAGMLRAGGDSDHDDNNDDDAARATSLQAATLLARALSELDSAPAGPARLVASRLMVAYAGRAGRRLLALRRDVSSALAALHRVAPAAVLGHLAELLRAPPSSEAAADLACAAASVALERGWEDTGALLEAERLGHDRRRWGWAVGRAAAAAASRARLHRRLHASDDHSSRHAQLARGVAAAQRDVAAAMAARPAADEALRACLARPGVADRVRADRDLLAVVGGLAGGYRDLGLADAMRQYRECASFIQMDTSDREPYTEFLARYGGDDTVWTIAVTLDSADRFKSMKGIGRIAPEWRPEMAWRSAPGVAGVVAASLAAGEGSRAVARALRKAWRCAGAGGAGGEALAALALAGERPRPACPAEALDAARRLERAARSLRDPVLRGGDDCVILLREAAGAAASAARWKAAAREAAQTLLACGSSLPFNHLYLWAPAEARPYVMAETWAAALVTLVDDVQHAASVMIGRHWSDNDSLGVPELVRGLACVHESVCVTRSPLGRDGGVLHFAWRVPQAPLRFRRSLPDQFLEVCDLFEGRESRLELARAAVWEKMLPWLASSDAGGAAPEALAWHMLQQGAWMRCEPWPLWRGEWYPRARVRAWALRVADPYRRARAAARVAGLYAGEAAERRALLRAAADSIAELRGCPVRRAAASEAALREAVRYADPDAELGGAPGAARAMADDAVAGLLQGAAKEEEEEEEKGDEEDREEDADNRVRMLLRLTFFLPHEAHEDTLLGALRVADARAPGEESLARALGLLRDVVLPFPRARAAWRRLARRRVRAPWLRALLARHAGFQLSSAGPAEGRASWNLLVTACRALGGRAAFQAAAGIHAAGEEAGPADTTPVAGLGPAASAVDDTPEVWCALLSPARFEAALRVLARVEGGVVLERTAALVCEALRASGRAGDLDRVLELITGAEPETAPLLWRWVRARAGRGGAFAAVLLAERGGISAELLPLLVPLLEFHSSWYHRARLVLGPASGVRSMRPYFASRLGRPCLEYAASVASESGSAFVIHALIRLLAHAVVYDDADAVRAWLDELRRPGGGDRSTALRLLTSIEAFTAPVREALREARACPSPAAQRVLLRQVMMAQTVADAVAMPRAHRFNNFTDYGTALAQFRAEVDSGRARVAAAGLGERCDEVLVGGPCEVVTAAMMALERGGGGDGSGGQQLVDLAEQELHENFGSTLAGVVAAGTGASVLDSFAVISNANMYHYLPEELAFARRGAALANDNLPLFRLLLAWMLRRLRQFDADQRARVERVPGPVKTVLRHLMLLVAAAAERMPSTFLRLVRREELEPLLVTLIRSPRSCRTRRHAAVTLLSFMHRVGPGVFGALKAVCREAALSHGSGVPRLAVTASRFQVAGEAGLDALVAGLRDSDTFVAYVTAQIMLAVGSSPSAPPAVQQAIAAALAAAIEDPASDRTIHPSFVACRIPELKRLKGAFFTALRGVLASGSVLSEAERRERRGHVREERPAAAAAAAAAAKVGGQGGAGQSALTDAMFALLRRNHAGGVRRLLAMGASVYGVDPRDPNVSALEVAQRSDCSAFFLDELVRRGGGADQTCRVCLEASVATVFLPCSHAVCCVACSGRVRGKCPVCRGAVKRTVEVPSAAAGAGEDGV